MKAFPLFFVALVLLAATACKNETQQPEIETVDTAPIKVRFEMPTIDATFKDSKTEAIFMAYQKLQNALVNTDALQAAEESKQLLEALYGVEAEVEKLTPVEAIINTNDVETQRAAFVKVTAVVEGYLKDALDSGALYKVHCPMAFKNTGASWLSSEKVVQNPYFGDKMYRCGRVEATIK